MTSISSSKNSGKSISKEKENDHKIVRGIFRCYEPRGGSFKFSFKKYKEGKIKTRTLVDGQTYDIPLMVAKHLNQNCWYPRHSYVVDSEGNPTLDTGKKVKRCSFESLEFHGEDE